MTDPSGEVEVGYRFAQVPEWVIYHPDLSGTDVRVFASLARHGRQAFPSLARLGELVHASADTVRRSLRALEKCGALATAARFDGARQTSNVYRLAGDTPHPPGAGARGEGGAGARGPLAPMQGHEGEQVNESQTNDSVEAGENAGPDASPEESAALVALASLPPLPFTLPAVCAGSPALPAAIELCRHMAAQLRDRGATSQVPKGGISKRWVQDMEAMIRIDGITPPQVRACLDWLHAGPDHTSAFWRANIWSPGKLRERYPRLREGYAAERAKADAPRHMERTPAIAHVTGADVAETLAAALARRRGETPPGDIDPAGAIDAAHTERTTP